MGDFVGSVEAAADPDKRPSRHECLDLLDRSMLHVIGKTSGAIRQIICALMLLPGATWKGQ